MTGQARYDRIGIGYNDTRKADPYLVSRFRHHLEVRDGGVYLDVGCGTGNYLKALSTANACFIGVDPSEEMLSKARQASADIEWIQGVAEDLPLEDDSVDGVMAGLTMHHWTDLARGLGEIGRVVGPGGHVALFSSSPEQTAAYWLKHYFPVMIADSAIQLPPLDVIKTHLQCAGLVNIRTENYEIQPDLEDCFLYSGKHRPEVYLDPNVRKGISTFSLNTNQQEVEEGLAKLAADIQQGEVSNVIKTHQHDLGDYIFILADRPKTSS